MDIKNYILNLLNNKKLTKNKSRKEILLQSWDKINEYINENVKKLNYKDINNIVTDYLSLVHDYGLLKKGDLFDLEKLYRERDLGANFDYDSINHSLKIYGSRDFFIYLSDLFNSIVKNKDYFNNLEEDSHTDNVIEFAITLRKDNDDKDNKKSINLENIVAVQFINWFPEGKNITEAKLYSVTDIELFEEDKINDYDFVKFSENEPSKLWVFTIKDDNGKELNFGASTSDNNLVFIGKKDLKQLEKDLND